MPVGRRERVCLLIQMGLYIDGVMWLVRRTRRERCNLYRLAEIEYQSRCKKAVEARGLLLLLFQLVRV